eukprot:m.174607 g.174607  ORF g.174607 m.174607 type:complete len:267 (+) comp14596_c0_seq1:51-851(+)
MVHLPRPSMVCLVTILVVCVATSTRASLDVDALLTANTARAGALHAKINALVTRVNNLKSAASVTAGKLNAAQTAVGSSATKVNGAVGTANAAAASIDSIMRTHIASLEAKITSMDIKRVGRNKYPWTQCSWWSMDRGEDSGRIFRCQFKKVGGAETVLRVSYNGDARSIVSGGGNRWQLRIDGQPCTSPGGTIDNRIHNNYNPNRHRPMTLSGFCHATGAGVLSAGNHWLEMYVDGPGDAYTGWASAARLMIQEYPIDVVDNFAF